MADADVAVIGAGFGGLAAALELAARGADVAVFEQLAYPGGCASTFERHGWQFESGATLFAGLDSHQLFGTWIDRWEIPVEVDLLDPVVEMRAPAFDLTVPASRDAFIERVELLPGFEGEGRVRELFDRQKQLADTLWRLFRQPELLPPFGASEFFSHLGAAPSYLSIVPLVGRSLKDVLDSYGLVDGLVERYFDAVCQITVQTDAARAEAPLALAATDYFFRGTGHIRGGIGELAWGIADTVERLDGEVLYGERVMALEETSGGWRVEGRRRSRTAETVVANLTPGALASMLPAADVPAALEDLEERVRDGWGAAMLYLGVDPNADLPDRACHLQLVGTDDAPYVAGNHVFCSVSHPGESDRAPDGERTVTCSTHVDMEEYLGRDEQGRADYIDAIHERMRGTIRERAPELAEAVVFEMTASPRTFERFTGRPDGFVGGIPRTAGWSNYRQLTPVEPIPELFLAGDTVFPGQSTLATAIGGVKIAERIAARHGSIGSQRRPVSLAEPTS